MVRQASDRLRILHILQLFTDERGVVFGHNYDDVETPLEILLNIWQEMDSNLILNESRY